MKKEQRTISILLDILNSDVWVWLRDGKTCRRFYENAEAEGFLFGRIRPTDSGPDDIIAVHRDRTLGHVGYVGRLAFHAKNPKMIRVDYARYLAGEKDFYYSSQKSTGAGKGE